MGIEPITFYLITNITTEIQNTIQKINAVTGLIK